MLDELFELIEFEWANIFKLIVGFAVMAFVVTWVWSGLISWNASLHPAPTPGPTFYPSYVPSVAASVPPSLQTMSSDNPALAPNKLGYPTTFTRDKNKDPTGVYFATLDYGHGQFPAVYININAWKKAGGRIINGSVNNWSDLYSVYTYKGTSNAVRYDRVKNVIYQAASIVPCVEE